MVGRAHLTLGADEATHVLHHPDDGHLHLVTEVDFFPDILEGHLLSMFKITFVSKSKYEKEKVCVADGRLQCHEFSIIKPKRCVPFVKYLLSADHGLSPVPGAIYSPQHPERINVNSQIANVQ